MAVEFLKNYKGGLIVISHDVELVGETVNRVLYLDAMTGHRHLQHELEELPMPAWRRWWSVARRSAPTSRRSAYRTCCKPRRFSSLRIQGRLPHTRWWRARREDAGPRGGASGDRAREVRFSAGSAVRRRLAKNLSKSYGSPLEIFTDVDSAIDRGSKVVVLGFNGAARRHSRHSRRRQP
ncbi:MAG: hypothetical protein U0Q04_04205 [Microbacterium sp.]